MGVLLFHVIGEINMVLNLVSSTNSFHYSVPSLSRCVCVCVCVCVCAYLMNLVEVIVYDLALCRRSKMVKRKKERERQRGSERDRERGREIERERERNRERGRAPLDE